MRDVQVEPHADGIGRHQIIDLARLIERHLPVARFGAERPITTAAPPRNRRSISATA
jgi:hypothetical protein